MALDATWCHFLEKIQTEPSPDKLHRIDVGQISNNEVQDATTRGHLASNSGRQCCCWGEVFEEFSAMMVLVGNCTCIDMSCIIPLLMASQTI